MAIRTKVTKGEGSEGNCDLTAISDQFDRQINMTQTVWQSGINYLTLKNSNKPAEKVEAAVVLVSWRVDITPACCCCWATSHPPLSWATRGGGWSTAAAAACLSSWVTLAVQPETPAATSPVLIMGLSAMFIPL